MLCGAVVYGCAAVWQAGLVYARIGDLEASDRRTGDYIAQRVTTNERRWEQMALLRDQVIRVEEQNKLILETVRRLENSGRR